MPTGYTAAIKDGIGFKQFALQCARGMGACIMQRDDRMDVPPQLQEPSDYHVKSLAKDRAEYDRVSSLTDEEAEAEASKEHTGMVAREKGWANDKAALKAQYEAMLANVQAWPPPTADHEGLKDFMIEQIQESIKWDCFTHTYNAVRLSGTEWRQTTLTALAKNIERSKGEYAKEIERTNGRNAWITALYESLNLPVSR